MSDLILHTDGDILDDLIDENADRMQLVQKKIKKPYVAINALTGALVKRFKSEKKLFKYLYTAKESALGPVRPAELLVRGYVITKETDLELEVSQIEWVAR